MTTPDRWHTGVETVKPGEFAPSYGDMDPESFRAAAHAVADLMADYLAGVERYAVLPDVRPGDLRSRFPEFPPEDPESLGRILADYRRDVEPFVTHWQHPGFFAYFSSSGSGPGILGEMLMATLIGNAMLWRTSPVATELEEVTVDWLRRALGLPETFEGFYTDTASTSSLVALAAARQAVAGLDASADGLAGGPRLCVYASTEAHSSIEKAAMTLGLGRAGLRRVAVDRDYALDPTALEAAVAEDRTAGRVPCAIVATIGTTSSTAIDPVGPLAEIAARSGLWLHVDAAYAGAAALLPECRPRFAGWEQADSLVVNPHKWLFTPLDCSLFLTRRPELVRASFSLVPEYLRTLARDQAVHDFNEYIPQLGRRFRALKMWFILRYFGLEGIRRRLREHIELAREFAAWVESEPDAELLAPVPFSTVCFRWHPRRPPARAETRLRAEPRPVAEAQVRADAAERRDAAEPDGEAEAGHELDGLNEAILERVNKGGEIFISHTRLDGRLALRLSVGNIRTERRHVQRAWEVICEAGRALSG